MQPGSALPLSGQQALPSKEDVDLFFKSLDCRPGLGQHRYPSYLSGVYKDCDSEEKYRDMYVQQGMSGMGVGGATTAGYHTDPGVTSPFLHAGTSPVYVPTTRSLLPGVGQYPGAASAGVQSAGTGLGVQNSSPGTVGAGGAGMWPGVQTDTAYSTPSSHHSRFAFPPTPSPSLPSPTQRADSGYGSALARGGALNPYSSYVGGDLGSAWGSFQQAASMGLGSQQGLMRSPGVLGELL